MPIRKIRTVGRMIDLVTALKASVDSTPMSTWEGVSPEGRRKLLERAIELSKKSGRAFAEDELVRDERTVRRWRNSELEIPDVVVRKLTMLIREYEKR